MANINGTNGADTLVGTAGNDLIRGGTGADTYLFGLGSGQDTISVNDRNVGSTFATPNTVVFGAGIKPSDLLVSSALGYGGKAEDMLIRIAGTQDSLLITSQLGPNGKYVYVWHDVTQFKFASGEVWTADQVGHMAAEGPDYFQGAGSGDAYSVPDVINGGAGNDTLNGNGGADTLSGGDGDDFIRTGANYYVAASQARLSGGAGDDVLFLDWGTYGNGSSTFDGGAGNDYILAPVTLPGSGVAPAMRYEYSRGFGADTIDGAGGYLPDGTVLNEQTIAFDATITPADVQFHAAANVGLVLRIKGSNDSILLKRIPPTLRFADGTVWTPADVSARILAQTALGAGDDVFASTTIATGSYNGGDGRDYLLGQAGDTLLGGAGDDLLQAGDGATLSGGDGNDTLLGGSGPWFTGRNLVLDGGAGNDLLKAGYKAVLNGGEGNDTLLGLDGSVLDGGAGDDVLRSVRAGTVTYKIGRASGHDTIKAAEFITDKPIGLATDPVGGGVTQVDAPDTIEFAADVSPADLQLQAVNGGFLLSILNSDTTVFFETPTDGLKPWNFSFPSLGTTVSGVDLSRQIKAGSADNDLLQGTAANDQLIGLAGNDTLDGGAGNDVLNGGAGFDVYRFGANWGQDVVVGAKVGANAGAQIAFTDPAMGVDQLLVRRAGADLVLVNRTTLDSVTIKDFSGPAGLGQSANAALVTLGDGRTLNASALLALANAGSFLDDQIVGSVAGDTLQGQAGNDLIEGGAGNDLIDAGAGNDTVYADTRANGIGQSDTLLGGDGDDFLFGGSVAQGGAGNDTITATGSFLTVNGGAGDDLINSTRGTPLVVQFGRGMGADTVRISDAGTSANAAVHIVEFDASVLPEDVQITLVSEPVSGTSGGYQSQVLFTILGTSDSLLVNDSNGWDVKFLSDGSLITPIGVTQMALALQPVNPRFIQGGSAGDKLTSTGDYSVVWGQGGNDTLTGLSSRDVLSGDDGDDSLFGMAGVDTLRGGLGNDYLDGGEGSDIYRFQRGWGSDTIVADAFDHVYLGPGILQSDLTYRRDGNNVVLDISGGDDHITLVNASLWNGGLSFDDGSTLTSTQVLSKLPPGQGVVLTGTNGHDTLTGGQGSDKISGGAGADVLNGGAGNDTLLGNTDADTLTGGLGADNYMFYLGDGHDLIHADAADTITLGQGLNRADMRIRKVGTSAATTADTVALSFFTGSDSLTLDHASQLNGLQLKFADGSTMAWADVLAAVANKPEDLTLTGTAGKDNLKGLAGNDTITGLGGSDTLAGGLGNDLLIGGKGNDTYLFNRGDGQDTIVDTDGTWFNADLLKVGSAKSNQLWLTRSGTNLDISIIGTTDKVSIQDWFNGSNNVVEKITALGDNKTLNASKVNALVNAMAAFEPPAIGETTLPTQVQSSLSKVLASSWT